MKIMDKISFYTALFSAKIINHCLHLIKSPGTSLPGYVAMRISKNFLSFISKYCREKTITVTGTNGKTTTSGLFANILKSANNTVLHNAKGANMPAGIATSLAVGYKPFSKFDYAVLETDEAYLTKLYDYINIDYLLLTNLFADQLDRYGESDTTAKKIQEAIAKNKELKLIVNADDPMLFELGKDNERIFFGFETVTYKTSTKNDVSTTENVICSCNSNLFYEEQYYGHVGRYYCRNCQKRRPEPKYKAHAVIFDDSSEIYVKYFENSSEKEYCFKTHMVGLYNAYNVLAAISLALELGINSETIQYSLDNYKTMFGRAEKKVVNDRNVFIQLIKNPTGANEVLKTINPDITKKILMIINDQYADGRDMSWLWDTNFELLKNYENEIVLSGSRAYDMAVRLKYSGFDTNKIVIKKEIKDAMNYALSSIEKNEQLLVMPTYTALLEMQKIWERIASRG